MNDKYGRGNGLKADLIERLKAYHTIRSNIVKMPKIDDKLLMYGYIRINEVLHGLYIPDYLKDIIHAYNESNIIGFCLSSKEPNYIFIANINHKITSNNIKHKAQIITLNDQPIESVSYESALTFGNSITLPSPIYKSITKYMPYSCNYFRVLFDAKASSTTLNLIHNDEFQMRSSQTKCTAFQWTLPHDFEFNPGHTVIYDNIYGLLAYDTNAIYSLSFNDHEFPQHQTQWGWKEFITKLPADRHYASCIMIKTNDNFRKLFVCHGSSNSTGNIYDLYKNEWISIKESIPKRRSAGICYNNMKQRIYTAGGAFYTEGVNNIVESYDLMKDKWFNLPNTCLRYDRNPMMWNHNHNLLFIGSICRNSLEYIDLRDRRRKWKIIVHPTKYGMRNDEMKNMFGLDWYYNWRNHAKLCVIKF